MKKNKKESFFMKHRVQLFIGI